MELLLFSEHKLVARSIQLMCKQYLGIEIVDLVIDDFDHIKTNITAYDIIMIDIDSENIYHKSYLDSIDGLIRQYPAAKIIILAYSVKPFQVEYSKKIGAYAFINKNTDPSDLLSILKIVKSGKKYFYHTGEPLQDYVDPLTEQEILILELSKRGRSIKEIEKKLYISRRTVFNHLNHIYSKLLVNNKQEAIYKAEQLGILGFS